MAKSNTSKKIETAQFTTFKYDRFIALSFDIQFDTLEAMAADSGISSKGVAYVFQYGLKQVFDDEIAGDKARIMGTAKSGNWTDDELAERAIELGLVNDENQPIFTRESLATAYCTALQTQQWKDLVDGTIGSIGERGPRLSGVEKVTRDVTRDMYHAACVTFNDKLVKAGKPKLSIPEGDELKTAHTAYYNAKKAEIDLEVSRRMESNKKQELSDDDAVLLGLVAK